jgi:HAD superfamily hydrolase (TIGR01490 family)
MRAAPLQRRSLTWSARAAIFDVDETLIAVSSLFSFLRFEMDARGRPAHEYERSVQALRDLAGRGATRHDVNRAYFELFAGRDAAQTAADGERWFEQERRAGGLFHPRVLAALWRHAAAGDLTLLVSGSFPACLDPIARYVGADVVLCSLPEIRDGRYTGRIAGPMLGEAKAAAVRAAAAEHGVLLADSHAYGDHASDLPILDLVGHPVVVGDDPVLAGRARRDGWAHIQSSPRPVGKLA